MSHNNLRFHLALASISLSTQIMLLTSIGFLYLTKGNNASFIYNIFNLFHNNAVSVHRHGMALTGYNGHANRAASSARRQHLPIRPKKDKIRNQSLIVLLLAFVSNFIFFIAMSFKNALCYIIKQSGPRQISLQRLLVCIRPSSRL